MSIRLRIAVIIILLLAFAVVAIATLSGSFTGLETSVYALLAQSMNPTLTKIMIVITQLGSFWAVLAILILLLVLSLTRSRLGVLAVIGVSFSALLDQLLKALFMRPRPEVLQLVAASGYGFPSGHSMSNAALYTIIILVVFRLTKDKRARVPVLFGGVLLVLLIGVSRIYLGVHSTGDVIAGWILGMAIALAVDTIWQVIKTKRQAK